MGFLLFAARKLQLKREINQLSLKQMQLSQEQQQISDQIAQQQQRQQQIQSVFNTVQTMVSSANQIQNNASLSQAYQQGGQVDATAVTTLLSGVGNNRYASVTASANLMNSVFTAQNNMTLVQLQNKDNEISMELESTESKLKLLQSEYDNVKKAEQSEAQNAAPTFGLA